VNDDGSMTHSEPNGETTDYSDDGSMSTTYPDGSTETMNAAGF
jgi:hypothetical protein